MTTKFAHQAWRLNSNALGLIFGMLFIVFSSDTKSAILGLAICMMFCTTQICYAIENHRSRADG